MGGGEIEKGERVLSLNRDSLRGGAERDRETRKKGEMEGRRRKTKKKR